MFDFSNSIRLMLNLSSINTKLMFLKVIIILQMLLNLYVITIRILYLTRLTNIEFVLCKI